jgi:thiol-disulfide isomerase/thioredoxin
MNFGNQQTSSSIRLPIGGDSKSYLSTITNGITNNKFTIITILLFCGIAIFLYFYYVSPQLKTSYKPNSEKIPNGETQGDNEAELLFFFADWCPHCKAAKPIWNDLKAEYENKTINGYHVVFTEIDCSTETAEVDKMMNKYNVEGYPTIKLLKDGQVIEYDAKPSKETLTQFLNTVL